MAEKIVLPDISNIKHEDFLYDMLVHKDELTWQTIIHELVKQEKMDPWDIDLMILSTRFLEAIKKLQEIDFRISGKVVLAAAILLRLKSKRLLEEDLNQLDRLLASSEQTQDEFYDEIELEQQVKRPDNFQLVPRSPQPRKRKVSVFDLINALGKALEVKNRRRFRIVPEAPEVHAPKNFVDINVVIGKIYEDIRNHYSGKQELLTFSRLVPKTNTKEDKVLVFIPLLHLANQRKIDLNQEQHFGEIEIVLVDDKKVPEVPEIVEVQTPSE